jgi:hypothetical protein
MTYSIKKFTAIFVLVFIFLPFISFSQNNQENQDIESQTSGANLKNAFGPGSNVDNIAGESGYKIDSDDETILINTILSAIINTVLSVLGLVFVILTILSGFKWMTAGGNLEQVNKAKASLRQSIIGLVIIAATWGIWSLVLQIINQF